MKHIYKIFIFVFSVLVFSFPAYARVYTSDAKSADVNSIYVVGNDDLYPIEYYDSSKGVYIGVLPGILEIISENTGIDFTYITGERRGVSHEMVSSHVSGNNTGIVDEVTVFSYDLNGKQVNIGFAFTSAAHDELIESVKDAVAGIDQSEIYGLFVEEGELEPESGFHLFILAGLVFSVSAALLITVTLIFLRLRKLLYKTKYLDSETGIGNYLYFEECFAKEAHSFDDGKHYAAYVVINGGYLQLFGSDISMNNILKYSAGVLASAVAKNECVARTGENGFVLMLESESEAEALERLSVAVDKLEKSVHLNGKQNRAVFHGALCRLDANSLGCEFVLFNLGRNCTKIMGTSRKIVVCTPKMMNSEIEEQKLEESIKSGFEGGEFKMYLQPVFDTSAEKAIAVEAVSRWQHPEKGLIYPGDFIKDIEDFGFAPTFDYYMFEKACIQLHKWNGTDLGDMSISCNFTRLTISVEGFSQHIREIAKKYVFEKNKLIMEITEDALELSLENAKLNIEACKKMGFRVALDDLGSGYTSLRNLCDYPIDIVKIDRDILLATESAKGKDIFMGMVAIAHRLELRVVCEGVETAVQKEIAAAAGCDSIQGWYFSKALPVKDVEVYLRERKKAGK